VDLTTEAFDRRLDPGRTAPIAVAYSGGGDSLAALIGAKAWADRCGRRLIAFTVDHRLQPQSAGWTAMASETARRLGAEFQALSWDGPKPSAGLAAAARAARHRLIAEAARAAGAGVIVFGHTADDILEADLMRAEGSMLGSLREWSPSPVWPEGRGLFLLRPLLGLRRAAIREALAARGAAWIDDPANDDVRLTRSRARMRISQTAAPPDFPLPTGEAVQGDSARLALTAAIAPEGYLRLDRGLLGQAEPAVARRVLAAALLSVGGGERPPRREAVERLLQRVGGGDIFQATLAGSKIVAGTDLLIVRDAGEARRGGLKEISAPAGAVAIWDGRFEVAANGCALSVRALAGAAARLDPLQHKAFQALPAAARPGLPAIVHAGGLASPILAGVPHAGLRSLVGARFLAACGAISKEPPG
jgi:tRNA(Ile)-lysidine synthase